MCSLGIVFLHVSFELPIGKKWSEVITNNTHLILPLILHSFTSCHPRLQNPWLWNDESQIWPT
jgi:hypothetical protein